jgi:protein-disulfide isomerase
MMELIRTDPQLRVVLKEFPVLGPGSVEAARVSIALKKQGTDKYLAFHQKMLGERGEANEQRALEAAKSVGADLARLKKDMADPEVQATLEESYKLANALGLSGTPSYVIGDEVVPGAVGAAALKEKVQEARSACGATC